ncbi:MAG: hypothetical protein KatS3mg023_3699 [Armatimonadota bacterium]|nr:MAG: hypothetical protein KatS3mg023_3699 [Armatimonadota bacterium]
MPGVGGGGGGVLPPLITINNFAVVTGGSLNISAGETVYLPFYSYYGGSMTDAELFILSTTATSIDWAVMDHDASGAPGNVLASGTWSSPTTGWAVAGLTASLDANQYYLFRLTVNGGSLTLMSPQQTSLIYNMYAHPRPILKYTTLWSLYNTYGYRLWAFMYRIGGTWYGNPLTHSNSGSPLAAPQYGLSFILPYNVRVVGAYVPSTSTTGGTTVSLYACDSMFLPTGSPIKTVSVKNSIGLAGYALVFFDEPVSIQRFSIIVSSGAAASPGYAYDNGTAYDVRLDRVYSFVRSVKYTGSSWQVVVTSNSSVIATQFSPIIDYHDAGSSVPSLVPSVFRGVERW